MLALQLGLAAGPLVGWGVNDLGGFTTSFAFGKRRSVN
jgi:hypothetical protein